MKTATLPADKIIEITSATNFTQPLDAVREESESPYRSPHAKVKEEGKDSSQAKRLLWTTNNTNSSTAEQPVPGAPVEEIANETSQAPCGPRNGQEEVQPKKQLAEAKQVALCNHSPRRLFPSVIQVKFDTMVENNLLMRVVLLFLIYFSGILSSHLLSIRGF